MGRSRELSSCDEKGRRIAIITYGCQMNVRDSEVICGLLKKDNWQLTTKPEEADVVILNTCSVRQHAEDKVWSEIGKFKTRQPANSPTRQLANSQTPKPIIGLVGCMAQNYKEDVFKRAPEVDFVVGPSDIAKIPKIIQRLMNSQLPTPNSQLFESKILETDGGLRPDEIYHTGFYLGGKHAYVVISEGCSNFCSYCVVPYVRGNLRNRDYRDILREIEEAIDKGINEITLLGQNVNEYESGVRSRELGVRSQELGVRSSEFGVSFIDLLRMVNQIKGLKAFSFITSHPKDTTLDLFKAMADLEKLKKYLHLPVQSGSDRILKLMNRGYTKEFYLDLAKNYRKIVRDGVLTTDIIVGFPGETEKDFQETYDLVKDIKFDAGYFFKYSPRPHTLAAQFRDDVPREEKERRHSLILKLQKEISSRSKGKSKK